MKPTDQPYLTPGQKALRAIVEREIEREREALRLAAIADTTQSSTTDPL